MCMCAVAAAILYLLLSPGHVRGLEVNKQQPPQPQQQPAKQQQPQQQEQQQQQPQPQQRPQPAQQSERTSSSGTKYKGQDVVSGVRLCAV